MCSCKNYLFSTFLEVLLKNAEYTRAAPRSGRALVLSNWQFPATAAATASSTPIALVYTQPPLAPYPMAVSERSHARFDLRLLHSCKNHFTELAFPS